jgi:hypothetical protein
VVLLHRESIVSAAATILKAVRKAYAVISNLKDVLSGQQCLLQRNCCQLLLTLLKSQDEHALPVLQCNNAVSSSVYADNKYCFGSNLCALAAVLLPATAMLYAIAAVVEGGSLQ